MKNSHAAKCVALFALLLVSLICWRIWRGIESAVSPREGSKSAVQNPAVSRTNDPAEPSVDPPARKKRPVIVRKDLMSVLNDRLEANGPELINSTVRTVIAEGHSVVAGGYLLADGSREFVVLTPTWTGEQVGGKRAVAVTIKLLKMNQQQVSEADLASLATDETKSRQNAEDWLNEDVEKTLKTVGAEVVMTAPSVTQLAGQKASVSWGSVSGEGFNLDVVTDTAPEGGFNLDFQIKRAE